MKEIRSLHNAELRASPQHRLAGYAAVFDKQTDLGAFHEVIRRGAFARAIKENQDVRCLFNHDPNVILGRTKAGTLKLEEDSRGLHFDCQLPASGAAQDVYEAVGRRDISECSFAFIMRRDRWEKSTDGPLRQILDCDLLDVSPVTYPAYTETTVGARTLFPAGLPTSIQLRVRPSERVTGGAYVMPPAITIPADPRLEVARLQLLCRLALADNEGPE